MTNIVFLDRATFPENMQLKRPQFPHHWQEYEATDLCEIKERLQNAEIVVTNKVPLDKATLSELANLKMIAITATGYNHIDIDYALQRSITVSNIRGYAAHSVPEHALMMMMSLSRSAFAYRSYVQQMNWQKADAFCFFNHPIEDLNGKTLCIVGRGSLGNGLAKLSRALGMKIIFAGRKGIGAPGEPYTPFGECLALADFISLHCPLTPDTKNLIATAEFEKMTKRPIVINTARGGIMNESDTVKALNEGLISALGIDCLSEEPPKDDNPLLTIADHPRVIITPHIAWASSDALNQAWNQSIENIECFINGAPRNEVLPAS